MFIGHLHFLMNEWKKKRWRRFSRFLQFSSKHSENGEDSLGVNLTLCILIIVAFLFSLRKKNNSQVASHMQYFYVRLKQCAVELGFFPKLFPIFCNNICTENEFFLSTEYILSCCKLSQKREKIFFSLHHEIVFYLPTFSLWALKNNLCMFNIQW